MGGNGLRDPHIEIARQEAVELRYVHFGMPSHKAQKWPLPFTGDPASERLRGSRKLERSSGCDLFDCFDGLVTPNSHPLSHDPVRPQRLQDGAFGADHVVNRKDRLTNQGRSRVSLMLTETPKRIARPTDFAPSKGVSN